MMRSKIGLLGDQPEDQILIKDLLDWMHNNDADFTNTFRDLSDGKKPTEIIYETSSFQTWYKQWIKKDYKKIVNLGILLWQ